MAYDGDICYQFDIPEEILREFEFNTSDYNYIFFFKRGELNILPTRESIEINDLFISAVSKLVIVPARCGSFLPVSLFSNAKATPPPL